MYDSHILKTVIQRPYQTVYDYLSQPENFVLWASGLENLQQQDGQWVTKTPQGVMQIRFTPVNAFGIADHVVTPRNGSNIYVPMRVIANENGAEVQLTLFRMSDMSDETYARDVKWVQDDLNTLKHLLEAEPA